MNLNLLIRKGFKTVKCQDGVFYVIEEEYTKLGNRIAKLCNFDFNARYNGYIDEKIILQANCDLNDFEVYLDGEAWDLTKEEFWEIVNKI